MKYEIILLVLLLILSIFLAASLSHAELQPKIAFINISSNATDPRIAMMECLVAYFRLKNQSEKNLTQYFPILKKLNTTIIEESRWVTVNGETS